MPQFALTLTTSGVNVGYEDLWGERFPVVAHVRYGMGIGVSYAGPFRSL